MTTDDVLRALLRRWYVALVVLLVTAAGIGYVGSRPGVYSTQVSVRFLPPRGLEDNTLVSSPESLIATAGLVQRSLTGNDPPAPTASMRITLADRGIYSGAVVSLPNSGGQWNNLFTEPALTVQAAGPSADAAATSRDQAVNQIRRTLRSLQDGARVQPHDRIRTAVVSPTEAVRYSAGHPARAVVVLAATGAGTGLLLCALVDRRLNARARRRTASAGQALLR